MTDKEIEELEQEVFTAFRKLESALRPLNPVDRKDKYLSLQVGASGFEDGTPINIHAFFDAVAVFDADSIRGLLNQIAACNPSEKRAERIAELEAQLAKLKEEGAK